MLPLAHYFWRRFGNNGRSSIVPLQLEDRHANVSSHQSDDLNSNREKSQSNACKETRQRERGRQKVFIKIEIDPAVREEYPLWLSTSDEKKSLGIHRKPSVVLLITRANIMGKSRSCVREAKERDERADLFRNRERSAKRSSGYSMTSFVLLGEERTGCQKLLLRQVTSAFILTMCECVVMCLSISPQWVSDSDSPVRRRSSWLTELLLALLIRDSEWDWSDGLCKRGGESWKKRKGLSRLSF